MLTFDRMEKDIFEYQFGQLHLLTVLISLSLVPSGSRAGRSPCPSSLSVGPAPPSPVVWSRPRRQNADERVTGANARATFSADSGSPPDAPSISSPPSYSASSASPPLRPSIRITMVCCSPSHRKYRGVISKGHRALSTGPRAPGLMSSPDQAHEPLFVCCVFPRWVVRLAGEVFVGEEAREMQAAEVSHALSCVFPSYPFWPGGWTRVLSEETAGSQRPNKTGDKRAFEKV
ncbi:hypothetical protein EYF80_032006 [Liparis tanakae]|uniref:Uncharacterized protein n=1 Tax=Liparis tanakae TaxID=230148 RepID=A0A4Z2GYT8_9TELE|nr:hypothetical protein EYF80_032006 [Liparis tanakae]